MSDAGRTRRARARQSWGGGLTRLDAPPSSTPPVAALDPAERIANCWAISVDAFLLSGRPWPEYERSEIPGRMIRRDAR